MSPSDRDTRKEVAEGLRGVRERARRDAKEPKPTPEPVMVLPDSPPLSARAEPEPPPPSSSPDREALNRVWDVSADGDGPGFVRSIFRRLGRLFLGPFVERQVRMNSLQVKFDNEIVGYVDERLDRMSRHYDQVLGLHGRRMEEIDERHSILQQELVRHVHDLVERIDFVFESSEQNHLYLEGMLRELREELTKLAERLTAPPSEKR